MRIWKEAIDVSSINKFCEKTLLEHLGITVTEFTPSGIKGTMPIDERTVQPYRVLHGGASVAFAESLGSIGSNLLIDGQKYFAVGQSINASHLRGANSGFVHANAELIHQGKRSHVWEINLYDDFGRLLCVSRLTMAIVEK